MGDASLRPGLALSDLIAQTGTPASTIHHYRRAGLLPAPSRHAGNRLTYDSRHVEALTLIRHLRAERGLSLRQIAEILPELCRPSAQAGWPEAAAQPCVPATARCRAVEAATAQWTTRSYGEVTIADIAAAAGMAKGSVYRHFSSKEDLFVAVVESLLAETATDFASAVEAAGGPDGIADDRGGAAIAFAGVVARAMPILLELGARAAKGHVASQDLAQRALVTMARAGGGPLVEGGAAGEGAVAAGLALIEQAFAVVLRWSAGDTWPEPGPLDAARP